MFTTDEKKLLDRIMSSATVYGYEANVFCTLASKLGAICKEEIPEDVRTKFEEMVKR